MIRTIIERMNGAANDPTSISAALTQLASDQIEVQAALDALKVERRQALLGDADDKTLDALERKIERTELKLEKLTVAEQPLRDRLAEAQREARRQQLEQYRHEIGPKAARVVKAAHALIAANDAYRAIVSEMIAAGFGAERAFLAALPPQLNGHVIAAPELIDRFAAEAERLAKAPLRSPPATTAGPAIDVSELTQAQVLELTSPGKFAMARTSGATSAPLDELVSTTQAPRARTEGAAPMPPRATRALRQDPLATDPSFRTIAMLRPGVELPDGEASMVGDRVTLNSETARALVLRGAADFVDGGAA